VLNNRFFLSVDHVFGTLKAFLLSWVSAQSLHSEWLGAGRQLVPSGSVCSKFIPVFTFFCAFVGLFGVRGGQAELCHRIGGRFPEGGVHLTRSGGVFGSGSILHSTGERT